MNELIKNVVNWMCLYSVLLFLGLTVVIRVFFEILFLLFKMSFFAWTKKPKGFREWVRFASDYSDGMYINFFLREYQFPVEVHYNLHASQKGIGFTNVFPISTSWVAFWGSSVFGVGSSRYKLCSHTGERMDITVAEDGVVTIHTSKGETCVGKIVKNKRVFFFLPKNSGTLFQPKWSRVCHGEDGPLMRSFFEKMQKNNSVHKA